KAQRINRALMIPSPLPSAALHAPTRDGASAGPHAEFEAPAARFEVRSRDPGGSMTRCRRKMVIALPFVVLLGAIRVPAAEPVSGWLDEYREPAARLIGAALADTSAWTGLSVLTDTIG